MKLFRQFLIIISFTFAGVVLQTLFSLPIPGSVIGMVGLFVALMTGKVRLDSVATVGDFLLENLSLFFLPAGVSLMLHLAKIKTTWPQLLGITVVTFALSFIVVGRVVQFIKVRYEEKPVNITEEDKRHVIDIDE
ncbi:CidA/LrgA family protein [Vagococcus lutrae]|uniref:Murein hydrolase regulator LrgA n=1 Tax=Vagococcus lutrae LBD1 TaxID=1408226 RepID=V6Q4Q5_9ENTE|nr:CidA/LrgA family protein [Vagococcus lutrae]EST89635.1 hypothetical protein T233_01390 [Vagococcus lutrae LBD1]NKZ28285.1 CidA/LrgA family protein [Vagococcus lutrae]